MLFDFLQKKYNSVKYYENRMILNKVMTQEPLIFWVFHANSRKAAFSRKDVFVSNCTTTLA